MTTIIFIRDKNNNDQEISGYIDYAQRLRAEDFVPYFERRFFLEKSIIYYYYSKLYIFI